LLVKHSVIHEFEEEKNYVSERSYFW